MLLEAQVGDHLGVQEAHGVTGGGIAETGMEFLGHGRTADDVASLQHPHLEAGLGQGAGPGGVATVVATAHYQYGGTHECTRREAETLAAAELGCQPHQVPVLGMLFQGSFGGKASPFCSSSIEMLSGVRMKAI